MKIIFASRIMFMDLTILRKVSLIHVFLFMKYKTSKTYIRVTVRILFSINVCLQDSYFFILVIILITFF